VTLYLDTSSAIKLYVSETGSDVVHALVGDAVVVATSSITYAETRAALARLRHDGALSVPKFTLAKREFEQQWPSFLKLDATDALCRTAGELAERYRLRGFDSVHLATFAEVAQRAGPRQTRFSSFDDRLNQAAEKLARRLGRQRRLPSGESRD
jgi:predicted nucleic acid-binding protein